MRIPQSIFFAAGALTLLLHSPAVLSQDSIAAGARAFVAKITALGPMENVELVFQNRTSLSALETDGAFQAVEGELRSSGMIFAVELQATARITVTLSENPQNYIWIAEVQRDQVRDLIMVPQPKAEIASAAERAPQMDLEMKLIIEQGKPVLDVAFLHGDLMVLDPGHLSLFRRQAGRWILQNDAPIPSPAVQPRDWRGRLLLSGESLQAYLPGLLCSASISPALTLECAKQDAPWPLEQGPARLETGKNSFVAGDLPAFFSAATTSEEAGRLSIFAGVDGRTVLYDDTLKPLGTITGWGSDIAGANSMCGTKRQIIVSLPRDPLQPGEIRAFEVVRRQAVAVSLPVELPGPVTALWPLPTQDAVVAISREINTGRYAAYQLSVVCGP